MLRVTCLAFVLAAAGCLHPARPYGPQAGPPSETTASVGTPNVTSPQTAPRAASTSVSSYSAVLDRYCITCHNEKLRTAGLTLDTANIAKVGEHAEIWEKVVRKLRTRAMPPAGRPRPDPATYVALTSWLEMELDRAAAAQPNPGRRPAIHRLNRAEYSNAVRDLLALDIDSASLLPPDDSGYGFDNIADVLSVSPMLTERYLSAARKIGRLAVGDPGMRPVTETFEVDKYLRQDDRVSDDLPFGSRGGLAVRHYFPVDGDYVVKIFLLRTYDGRVRGLAEPHVLEARLNGQKVAQFTVGGAAEKAGAGSGRDSRNSEDDGREVRFSAAAGPAVLAVSFVDRASVLEGMRRPTYAVTSYEYAGDATIWPGIASVELRGPYDVKGRGDTPSRRRIFGCRPTSTEDAEPCARRIVSALARRAYRRPATDAEVALLLGFYETGRHTSALAQGVLSPSNSWPRPPGRRPSDRGVSRRHEQTRVGGAPESNPDFDAGIEMALRRILVSPAFLFRTEQDPVGGAPGSAYRITDLELASRLSFFLWSSIPDDELLEVAERGELRQPAVLEQQVRRMLADARSKALVSNFGGQWLYLRNVRLVAPDPHVFPDFDANLRRAFERETELFLESQLREDRSASDLLDADYTFVNERLAEHYGIPNVYGNHFRRVTLTDEARRGLLGKGSILTATSYAHRTSPVLRGKWLLENILGTPPPPPPPNVPALKENDEGDAKRLSVRERMEAHRANPVCATCHRIMDPLGFALENFDAIGKWRTNGEAGTPIDASGELADGTKVDGPVTLRQALIGHREDFITTVTEKLLTYALGRGVEYYDRPAIRQIVRDAAEHDYRWSSLIVGIVESTPFQMRSSAPAQGTVVGP